MKKIFTILICAGLVVPMFAQKSAVDQAKKLSGKPEKLSEARSLIKQAMENPETKDNAETYYVAGKIEFDAYDNGIKTKMINPNDASVSPEVMGQELLDGYNYFIQALPLDSLPNEKGQVKPKFSKDIYNKIMGHESDFFNVGGDYYNAKMFYPQAYEAFILYGDLPTTLLAGKGGENVSKEQIATAYFNAGLAAYSGNEVEKSAEAFKKARLAGYEQPEAYIYEIACWQNIAQTDSVKAPEAQKKIMETATAGHNKFGLEQPIFFNNMINSLVSDNQMDAAIAQLNDLIAANPDKPSLLGLRAYVYDRAEKDDLSEADYRKAASMPDVDYETLKNAGKKLYRIGQAKLNAIEGNSAEDNAARQNIKTNYFEQAKKYADQAKPMNEGNDPDLDNLYDAIDYIMTTNF